MYYCMLDEKRFWERVANVLVNLHYCGTEAVGNRLLNLIVTWD